MDELARRYADRGVTSVFIYTREAHPGEHYPHHRTMADKRSHATAFRDQFEVQRPILLDDLEGSVHHEYGLLPNMSWIVGPRGRVLYKAAWTWAADIEDALVTVLEQSTGRGGQIFYSERAAWRDVDRAAFRAGLERAGPQAVRDFYGDRAPTDES